MSKVAQLTWQHARSLSVGHFAPSEVGFRVGDAVVHMPRWGADHPSVFRMSGTDIFLPSYDPHQYAMRFLGHGASRPATPEHVSSATMHCTSGEGAQSEFQVSTAVITSLQEAPWDVMFAPSIGRVEQLYPHIHQFLPILQYVWRGETPPETLWSALAVGEKRTVFPSVTLPPDVQARIDRRQRPDMDSLRATLSSSVFLQSDARFNFVRNLLVTQFSGAFGRVRPSGLGHQLGEALALSDMVQHWFAPAGIRENVDPNSGVRELLAQQVAVRLLTAVSESLSVERPAAWATEAALQQLVGVTHYNRVIADYGLSESRFSDDFNYPGRANLRMMQHVWKAQAFRAAACLARQIGARTEDVIDEQYVMFRTMLMLDFCDAVMHYGHRAAAESLAWMEAQHETLPRDIVADRRGGMFGYGYVHGVLFHVHAALNSESASAKRLEQVIDIVEYFPEVAQRERVFAQAELWYRGEIAPFFDAAERGDWGRALSHVDRILDYIEGSSAHDELERLAALGRVWHMAAYDSARTLGVVNRPGRHVPQFSGQLQDQYANWMPWRELLSDGVLSDESAALVSANARVLRAALESYDDLSVASSDDAFALYTMRWLVSLAERALDME